MAPNNSFGRSVPQHNSMRIEFSFFSLIMILLPLSYSSGKNCIDSPEQYACKLAGCYGKTLPIGLIRGQLPDTDGDNAPEALVTFQTECKTAECLYHIFLSNKGCFSYAGRITGKSFTLLKTRHFGKLDIEGWSAGSNPYEGYRQLYHYDGKQYTLQSRHLFDF